MSSYPTPSRAAIRPAEVLHGKVVTPEHGRWDDARQARNLAVDQQPAAVVFPTSTEDVIAAVHLAAHMGFDIAAQGTGHNAGPLGSLEYTLLIKTEEMRAVGEPRQGRRVDPVPLRFQRIRHALPAPAAMPGAVNEDERLWRSLGPDFAPRRSDQRGGNGDKHQAAEP